MQPDLTPKQQTSEAIRQAETILILTGQHPTMDQVASTVALASILRKYGKKVTAIISDGLPNQASMLPTDELDRSLAGQRDFILKVDLAKTEVDKLRYAVEDGKLNIYITPFKGGFAPSDVTFAYGDYKYDLAIVLGVPTRARIDKLFQENASLFERVPLVNFDYHRSNEQYGAINLIEPTAASLSEMLVALAESLQSGLIDETVATCLLAGIMSSTDRFTASHTTPKSLTVAAQMMAAGAKQQTVVKGLFRDSRSERSDKPRRDENKPAKSEAQPQPVQKTETPMAEAPIAEVIPMASIEAAQERAEDTEPIIQPGHIEPMPEDMIDDLPLADFAEAADGLERVNEPTESDAS
jgi:nanoRNase/pAp phosphatase (c-di-AMP/oligoRNAs hydrolase)